MDSISKHESMKNMDLWAYLEIFRHDSTNWIRYAQLLNPKEEKSKTKGNQESNFITIFLLN